MEMNILLDTNAYSALMSGKTEIVQLVKQVDTILLSDIVIGELLFGFRNGNRAEKNIAQLQRFLENPFVKEVNLSGKTADRYSRIAVMLRKKGRPIPTNDIWIAAHTVETGTVLLSYDKHFSQIDGLAWKQLR